MPPEHNMETTLLTLMFLMGMLVGGVISFIMFSIKESRLEKQRREE
jgi:uncharacterized membrane protein YciS (DUF1049 family)